MGLRRVLHAFLFMRSMEMNARRSDARMDGTVGHIYGPSLLTPLWVSLAPAHSAGANEVDPNIGVKTSKSRFGNQGARALVIPRPPAGGIPVPGPPPPEEISGTGKPEKQLNPVPRNIGCDEKWTYGPHRWKNSVPEGPNKPRTSNLGPKSGQRN